MPESTAPKTTLLVSGRADSSPFKTHMMPTEHFSQSMCFRRAQTTFFWRWSRVPGCGACREPGLYVLPPPCPGNWSFSLLFSWLVAQPCTFQVPESSSFYGVRSHWELLRGHETNCARLFQISMPGNPSSILLNTDPFLSLWKWGLSPQEKPFSPTWALHKDITRWVNSKIRLIINFAVKDG